METTAVRQQAVSQKSNVRFDLPNMASLLALLSECMKGPEAKLSVKEAAEANNVSVDTLYYALRGKKPLQVEVFMRVAYMLAVRGDVRVIELLLPNSLHITCGHVQPDGSIGEELQELVQYAGDCVHCHKARNRKGFEASAQKLVTAALHIKAEGELIHIRR